MSESISATYRGFRNQALYILHRLLTDEDAETKVYRPEGAEDLAVYRAGRTLIEAIQVKDHGTDLSLSALNPKSPKGFFARFQTRIQQHPHCSTKIVSFGDLGPELQGAIDGDEIHRGRITAKLCENNPSISSCNASAMLAALQGNVIHPVSQELLAGITEKLRDSAVSGDLDVTVSLLMSWVFEASEYARDLTKDGLLKQINRISAYLAALRDNSAYWGTTIQLLEDRTLTDDQCQLLTTQYRQGIQARWEHILANADCIRFGRLLEIRDKIQRRNVVILRGASGQGKSSLGWRYMRDFCADGARFSVRLVENRQQALEIANALGNHVRKLDLKATVYLDVAPADTGWTELVRELAVSGLKVLIAIREEDFRRANVALGDFEYAEVVLDGITKEEAEPIFALLSLANETQVLDFDEAWGLFASAEQGPLLEFTYLAFQGELLDSRIAAQISRIQDEAGAGLNGLTPAHLDLLALTSIAAETGAGVNFEALCSAVGINPLLNPLRQLADEYLIQESTDGGPTIVGGLHSVRSRSIVKALFSTYPEGWVAHAIRVLPLIVDRDLSAFLLCAFSRHPEATAELFEHVCRMQLRSWSQAAAITSALLWEGINRYEKVNHETIAQAVGQFETAWWLLCDSFVGMPNGEGMNTAQLMQSTVGGNLPRIELSPKAEVYELFRQWVRRAASPPTNLSNRHEWPAAGDVAYWIGLINTPGTIRTALENILPTSLPSDVSIEELGLFIEGRSILGGAEFQDWFTQKAPELRTRFVVETSSVYLNDDGSEVKIYFSVSNTESDAGSSDRKDWHAQTLRRIRLLRLAFPQHETYSSQGIGVEIFQHLTGHDPTTKVISASALPRERSVRLNSQFLGLVAYRHSRCETWREYISAVLAFRKEVSGCFRKLHRGWGQLLSERMPRQTSFRALPGDELDRLKVLSKIPMFPRSCVDEWGFLSEQTSREEKDSLTMQEASLSRFDAWKKAFANYESGVGQVTLQVLPLTQVFWGEHQGRVATAQENANFARLLYNLAAAWESIPAMQDQFHVRFEKLGLEGEMGELDRNERSNFSHLWPIAFAMVNNRTQRHSAIGRRLEDELDHRRARFLQAVEEEISMVMGDRGNMRILEGSRNINGVGHLCIICDYVSLQALESCAREIPAAIWRASQSGGWQRLEWKPLEIEWPRIATISLVRGKATSPSCAASSSLDYFGTPENFETHLHQYARVSMVAEEFETLGLSLWDSPLLRATQSLLEDVHGFLITVMRYGKLVEIIHQKGLDQVQQTRIFKSFEPELSSALTAGQRSFGQIVEVLKVANYDKSEEWTSRLRTVCQALLMELDSDRPFSLNMATFLQWLSQSAENMRALKELATEIMLFVTSDE